MARRIPSRSVAGAKTSDSQLATTLEKQIALLEQAISELESCIQINGQNLVVKMGTKATIQAGAQLTLRSTGDMQLRAPMIQLNPPAS